MSINSTKRVLEIPAKSQKQLYSNSKLEYLSFWYNLSNELFTMTKRRTIFSVMVGLIFILAGNTYATCPSAITSYPYAEGFNNSLGDWTQDTGDDFDWEFLDIATPSGGTGPSAPFEGSHYLFIEASGGTHYPEKTASVISPCFNVTTGANIALDFAYHMYSDHNTLGGLYVDVSTDDGATWSLQWELEGNQGNTWFRSIVSFIEYEGQDIRVRFRAVTGPEENGWSSDIAIDDIQIHEINSGLCYALAQTPNGQLYSWLGADYTHIGSADRDEIETICLNFDGTIMYAIDASQFGTIDMNTGAFTFIADVGSGDGALGNMTMNDIDALTLNPTNGYLMAVHRRSANDLLFAINPATGQIEPNYFGNGIDYREITGALVDIDDIAFHPTSHELYAESGISGSSDTLDRIVILNQYTGEATIVSVLPTCDIEGLTFDNEGNLYGTIGNDSGCEGSANNTIIKIDYTVNPGVITKYSELDHYDVEGAACFISSVEPCITVEEPGEIAGNQTVCAGVTPSIINNVTLASSNTGGTIEYQWYKSTTSCVAPLNQDPAWVAIDGANESTYSPNPITETTCFVRATKKATCPIFYKFSNVVSVTFDPNCTCGDGTTMDHYGAGCDGTGNIAIVVPNTSDIIETSIEIVYKSCDAGDDITVSTSVGDVTLPKTYTTANGAYVYRLVISGYVTDIEHISECGGCNDGSGLQSVLVFVKRSTDTAKSYENIYAEHGSYCDVESFNLTIQSVDYVRDISVVVPFSEMTDDGRYLTLKVSDANQTVSVSETIFGPDLSLGSCCFSMFELTLKDVPAETTELSFEVITDGVNNPDGSGDCGQSWVMATTILLEEDCCPSINEPGVISGNQTVCAGDNPSILSSVVEASSDTGDAISYQWFKSTTSCDKPTHISGDWTIVAGATSPSYDPGEISMTTCYVRAVQEESCNSYNGFSNVVRIGFDPLCIPCVEPINNNGDLEDEGTATNFNLNIENTPALLIESTHIPTGWEKRFDAGQTDVSSFDGAYYINKTGVNGDPYSGTHSIYMKGKNVGMAVVNSDTELNCGAEFRVSAWIAAYSQLGQQSNADFRIDATLKGAGVADNLIESHDYIAPKSSHWNTLNWLEYTFTFTIPSGDYNELEIVFTSLSDFHGIMVDDLCIMEISAGSKALAGPDQSDCINSFTMAANTPTAGYTGTWTVVSGNANITTPNSPTTEASISSGSSATLRWTVSDGTCSSYDDMVITLSDDFSPGTISGDESHCGGYDPTIITGTAAHGCGGATPIYMWKKRPLGGSWTVISGATSQNYDPPYIDETYEFERKARPNNSNPWTYSNIVTKEVTNEVDVIVTGSTTICEGETSFLSPTTGGTWTSTNTAIATVTASGGVTGTGEGDAYFVFTSDEGCTSLTGTPITVIGFTDVELTGPSSICEGDMTTVEPSSGGLWSTSDASIASVSSSGVVSGISEGTVILSFTQLPNGCTSDETIEIIVKPRPVIEINGPTDICVGDQQNILPSSGGTWVSSNTAIATITDGGLITAISGGTVYFVFSSPATGCSSENSTEFTVSNIPSISIIGSSAICTSETTTLSPTSGGTWASSNTSIATVNNDGIVTGVASGTASFIFTNNAGCPSDDSVEITISETTTVDIIGPTDICEGETTTLRPTSGGTWASSNTSIATVSNSGVVTGINAGLATFVFTSANSDCSSNATAPITINPTPVISFDDEPDICVGSTTNVSSSETGTWSSSDIAIATVTEAGLVTGISSGIAYLTFTPEDGTCSATFPNPVTIYDRPDIEIVGPSTVCIYETTQLNPTAGGTWSSSNTSVATITNTGVVTALTPGTVNFIFTETGSSCVSEASDDVTVLGTPIININGSSSICVNETTSVNATADGVTLEGTWVSSNTNVATITNEGLITGISQGIARFTFTSVDNCSSSQSSPIIIYGIPTINIIGSSILCVGDQGAMLPNSGGTWTSDDNTVATIDNFGIITTLAPGTVRFTYTDNVSSCSSEESEPITVAPIPVITIAGSSEICIGSTAQLIPAVGGVWTSSNTSIAVVDNQGVVTGVSAGVASFTYQESSTNCSSEDNLSITVIGTPSIDFIGPTELCIGETSQMSPNSGGNWSSTNELIATITNDGIITAISQGIVRFVYINTTTDCSSEESEPLTVNGTPIVGLTGPNSICIGNTTNVYPSTGGEWVSSDPAIATINNNGEVIGISDGTASFTFTDNSTECPSDGLLTIAVEGNVDVEIIGESNICIGYTTALSPSSGGLWISNNPDIATITNSGIVTGRAPGVVSFQFMESEGCASSSNDISITVGPCINSDFNVTLKDMIINGNINTNDNVPENTTYNPQVVLSSKPPSSIYTLTVGYDGTYSFVGDIPGKYIFEVPVCVPPMESGCPSTILEITVLDDVYSKQNPVCNLEFTTTYDGSPVILDCISNDKCVNTAICELSPTNMTILGTPSHGTISLDTEGKTTYTPNPGYIGFDTVYYKNCEDSNPTNCSESYEIITINHATAKNTTVASDEFVYTMEDIALSGNVSINDSDAESDAMSVVEQGSITNPISITGGSYYIASTGEYTFIPAEGFTGATEFVYEVCDNNAVLQKCVNATVHILVFTGLELRMRVYLEGALMQNGNAVSSTGRPLMRDNLRVSPYTGLNYIPLQDPYTIAVGFDLTSNFPHIGAGLLPDNITIPDSLTVFGVTGENAIVDWVHVEIRDKNDYTNVLSTRSGLVQRDGDVVDLDGISLLNFDGVNQDSFYVVIKHRTHLGTMTTLVPNDKIIDFTDPDQELFNYGTSLVPGYDYTGLSQNSIKQGYNCLWAGNFNSDNRIKFTNPNDEINLMLNEITRYPDNMASNANFNYAYGYLQGDYNMDGKNKFTNPNDDKNMLLTQIILYPLNTRSLSNFGVIIEQVPQPSN